MATDAPPRLLTLILLSALSVLPVSMFLPSLNHIAATFHADYALVNLAVAGYAAMAAMLQLALAPLSDRYGRRPVILAGITVFILASMGSALAGNIWVFLGFRLLQATVISGYAVSLAVVRDSYRPEKAASLIGYVATAWAVAPMLGPMVGGLLDELAGWRACFWAFAALGVAVLALCWLDLRETNRRRSTTLASQLRTYPALLRSQRFWGYAVCMAFSTGSFYAFLGGAPLVASTVFHTPPAMLGVYMGSTTVGFMLGSFLSGRTADRYPLTTTMIAGRVISCTGLAAGLLLVLAGEVHVASYFGACVLSGMGNGLTMPSSNAGALSIRPELAGSASGLAGALTVGGGALMSSVAGAVLTQANCAPGLLAVMLASSLTGLAGALYVRRMDRTGQEAAPA